MSDHIREVSIDIIKEDHQHQHKITEMKTEQEINKQNLTWTSCCFTLNRDAVIFFSHYSVLVSILITSIIGVFTDPSHLQVWLNLLLLIVGMLTPAPQLKNNKEK